MIEIKTLLHGWKEVSKERAAEWAKHIWKGSINIPYEEKYNYINSKLRGITAEELLKNEQNS